VSYYYLSNPYNGSPEEMQSRAQIAAEVCAALLRKGIHAWSPIVHNHALMEHVPFTLEERKALMLPFDFTLLKASQGMIVLTISGWDKSYGVGKEIALCKELNIPVKYLHPEDAANFTF
jgi:hypothetical protein